MITSTADAVRASQDQFLTAVRDGHRTIAESVAAWAAAVEKMAPAAAPPAGPPALHAVPTPDAVVDNTFDFAQRLLNAQRDFARDVVSATAPIRAGRAA